MPIIQVKNLSKNYEYWKKQPGILASVKGLFYRKKLFAEAVKNISFEIQQGELVGFLGPNGAGKTTTLKILSGILYPTSGEARILNYVPWQRNPNLQKQFALVMGQKYQLWWDLPAMESFILNKEIYGLSQKEFSRRLDELSELLDVKDILNIQTRKLSLGQRMKCELIAALLHKPKILFLDEPTIGLDVISQKKIRDFIARYNREEKTTIILTSHYMEDIKELCKRVVIIDLGKIIYDGELDQLIKKYADYKELKITFEKPIERNKIEKFGKIVKFNQDSVILSAPRKKIAKIASEILNFFPVDDILIDEPNIAEVTRKIFESGKKY
jgi:ABC-2 type transport system ATP-binding protein